MFLEKDMYPNVQKNLRSRFPANEGWEIHHKYRGDGYELDFLVERVSEIFERIIVEVKSESVATLAHIEQINRYAKSLSGNNSYIVGKILVYPSGADTSKVPNSIEKMILREFCWK